MADDAPLEILDDGFVDPASPESLHPALRGEGGLKLTLWLRDGGVTASLVSAAAETFRLYAKDHQGEPWQGGFHDLLRTAIYHHGFDSPPRFALLLRKALEKVDGPAQWEGLLLFLCRTSMLLTLDSGSGPIPLPRALSSDEPEVAPGYPWPQVWYCIYCGWRCDQGFAHYRCGSCKSVRPFADGSATMIQCGVCRGMSLALARFCAWCGLRFAETAEHVRCTTAAPGPGIPVSSRPAEGLLYCIFCGSACDTSGGNRACQNCLREIPDPMSSSMGKACPKCQGFNLMSASYCERCGERFEDLEVSR